MNIILEIILNTLQNLIPEVLLLDDNRLNKHFHDCFLQPNHNHLHTPIEHYSLYIQEQKQHHAFPMHLLIPILEKFRDKTFLKLLRFYQRLPYMDIFVLYNRMPILFYKPDMNQIMDWVSYRFPKEISKWNKRVYKTR